MTSALRQPWQIRLKQLCKQRPSNIRDVALSIIVDEDFDIDKEENINQLFLAFTEDIDISVLQSFENALARADVNTYYAALGRCYEAMAHANPRIATERINFPAKALSQSEKNEAYEVFSQNLRDHRLFDVMRKTIVEWRLLGDEPYRTFFMSSLIKGGQNG